MIDKIRDKIANGQFEYSRHAVDQSILRHITVQELHEAVATAEIIEDYPNDKYGPSCLMLGFTSKQLLCTYNAAIQRAHLSKLSHYTNLIQVCG